MLQAAHPVRLRVEMVEVVMAAVPGGRNWDETVTNLNRKIAEYAQAVVDGRPCFHISLVIDVSPNCDCHPENDAAIIPNVGMFASFDPVALDMACADAVNAQPPLPGAGF